MLFFFFNDTATTEIYTLSLHDALPIYLPLKTNCNCSKLGNRGREIWTVEMRHRNIRAKTRQPADRNDAYGRGLRSLTAAGPNGNLVYGYGLTIFPSATA